MVVAGFLALPVTGFAQTSAAPAAAGMTTAQDRSSAGSPQEHLQKADAALNSIASASVSGKATAQIAQLKKHVNAMERMATNPGPAAPASAKSSANWATEAAAADKILGELLASDAATGTAGASSPSEPKPTGTSGVAPSKARTSVSLDDDTKAKLTSVRASLTAFAVAMTGTAASSTGAAPAAATAAPATAASASPAASPAAPAASPAAPAASPAAPTTAPVTPASPSPSAPAAPAEPATATAQPSTQAPAAPATQPPAQPANPTAPADPSAPEAQPPAAPSTAPAAPGAQATVDADAAKRALTAARDALSQMTQLPAAAQLAGENRTQVAQLISNFNELITTSAEWRAAYAKVDSNVTALIGADTAADSTAAAAAEPTPATPPANAAPEAVGTSGAAASSLDPALKAKLVEFRTHLKTFEKAAGGAQK
jgi:hypothetical protein